MNKVQSIETNYYAPWSKTLKNAHRQCRPYAQHIVHTHYT